MKFIELPEPCISTGHVLAVSPLLYRLDVHTPTGYIVVSEYQDRRPSFSLNGDMGECQVMLRRALIMLTSDFFNRIRWSFIGEKFDLPVFTLDMRTPTYQAFVSGLPDDTFRVTMFGDPTTETFKQDIAEIGIRLTELLRVYYQ